MPNYNVDNALNDEIIEHIKSRLPRLDVHMPVSFEHAHEDLTCYFDTYGFNLMTCIDSSSYALGYIDSSTCRIACHRWFPDKTPRGSIFVAHGLFDHVGLYLDVIDHLVLSGFAVVAIDFPGHGLSGGPPAEIADFSEYADIVAGCLDHLEKALPQPIYGLGQSTGCAALLSYVLVGQGEKLSRLVLMAPLIQPRRWLWISAAHRLLSPFIQYVNRSFTINSHRESFCEFLLCHDPLQTRKISVKWIGAMKQWVQRFDALPVSMIDCLIIQGTCDGTVQWEKNLPRIQAKMQVCRIEMLEGAMHHLANEGDVWRGELLTKSLAFFLRNNK